MPSHSSVLLDVPHAFTLFGTSGPTSCWFRANIPPSFHCWLSYSFYEEVFQAVLLGVSSVIWSHP